MPLNKKGKKIMKSMKEQYGSKKGKTVFYASMNKGVIKGVEKRKQGGAMSKKPYEKFKDTTKQEYESKKKRFPMMPKDEFDIRFENNPDFFESGVSRAYTGGLMSKKNKRIKELEEELGINTKPTRPAPKTGSPYPTPPKKGPASKGMKQGGFLLTPQQKMQSQNAQKQIRNIEQRKLQRDVEQMQMDRNPPQMKEGGDIDSRVEEELKKETPNAYPMMKGLSPITHLRRYLKKRELLSKKEKGIGLYDSPKTESKSGFGKVFKEARKKGEGTKFKYKEKDYSAVTKEDVSKSGKSSLKDYLDSPSKMKSGGSVMVKTKLGRNKPTRLC